MGTLALHSKTRQFILCIDCTVTIATEMFSHSRRIGVEKDVPSADNGSSSTTVIQHRYVTIVHRYKGTLAFLIRLLGGIDSPPVGGQSGAAGNDRRVCENDSAGF